MHDLNIAILSFGVLQCVLLAIALMRHKEKRRGNIYLFLFIVVIGLQLAFKLISKAWLWEHVRTIYMISYNYGFLPGPLVFLFFRSQRKLYDSRDWVHFLPFAFSTLLTLLDELAGITFWLPINEILPWPWPQIVSLLCYSTAVWKLCSNNNSARQFIVLTFMAEACILFTILFLVRNLATAPDLRLAFTALTALIYWITYKFIAMPDAFSLARQGTMMKLVLNGHERYANSGLRPEESKSIIERLKQCIEKDHILLQPEITLDDVAKKLSVRKHHLSQAINQEFGHSFTELVYNYRLDEAARRLSDLHSRNQKISAIAYDLGFSSVSVFTTKFRKRFNVTPSVFRETSGGESRQLTPGA